MNDGRQSTEHAAEMLQHWRDIDSIPLSLSSLLRSKTIICPRPLLNSLRCQNQSTTTIHIESSHPPLEEGSHLNPPPSDYSHSVFTDKAIITLHSGAGGHGCVSFLREKYIAAGPANGGDRGTDENVYIQGVRGETSLHKLARRGNIKARRGKNGQGKIRGRERGDDIIITVPDGAMVRETERIDPMAEENERVKLEQGPERGVNGSGPWKWSRDKWLLWL